MILPTTNVGSFPKPDYVKESTGVLTADSKRAVKEFIDLQMSLDMDILVDGELYRGDMATDYARALALPIADWTRSYNNRFWKKGIVDRPLIRKNSIQLEPFQFAQSLTTKPVKGMLTGPTTLANWNYDNYYFNRKDLIFAWAKIINEEALELEQAGAKYIQIDEPAIAERHWEKDLFRKGLELSVTFVTSYIITHICYSDFVLVYSNLKHLPVNQIDIELSNELDNPDSELLQTIQSDPLTNYKDVAVGVIDVRPGIPVEDIDTVVQRIKTACKIFNPEKIWIKPDCGFRTTKNPVVAQQKLEVMMQAVKQIRKEFL